MNEQPSHKPIIVGIDPGLSGGIAAMTEDGRVLDVQPLPVLKSRNVGYDVQALCKWFADVTVDRCIAVVFIEKSAPRPTDSRSALYSCGYGAGQLAATVMVLGHGLAPGVNPATWRRTVLGPTLSHELSKTESEAKRSARRRQLKLESIAYVKRQHPYASLRPTARCRVDSDGMAEAICIAEYGRRVHFAR